ncbi:MAG: hypothetical protein GC185_06760 [Alphaproteobacteria bacterium]|nr:hypothetical protein [Alphaproteobacteria bacterium]
MPNLVFNYKKKVVDPFIRQAFADFDAAVQERDVPERVEKLLALRENVKRKASALRGKEAWKGAVCGALAVIGFGLILGPTILADGAVAAGGIVMGASFFGGLALFAAAAGGAMMNGMDRDQVSNDARVVETLVNAQLIKNLQEAPGEVVKSPRFVKRIAEEFNKSAMSPMIENLRVVALRARVGAGDALPSVKK